MKSPCIIATRNKIAIFVGGDSLFIINETE